jgi:hypothetical protein
VKACTPLPGYDDTSTCHFLAGFFPTPWWSTKLRFTVIGIGGRLTQALAVPVQSASAARWRAIATEQRFKCDVVVTDEKGMRVAMAELEELAKAEPK